MSRHREIRKINYTEYGLDYDEYGRSVEDDAPISPTDARQWLFDRERGQQSVSSFLANHRDIEEEDEEQCEPNRRNSESFERPPLADDDRAKLESAIDEIRNVIGDAASDRQLVATVMRNNFDYEKSLAEILNEMSQKQEPQVKVNEKKETIEKGIGSKLLDNFKKPAVNTPIIILPISDRTAIRRGFEPNSPQVQSPSTSGRNTPEITDEIRSRTKEQASRDAMDLFKKERGDEKDYIHMVVIGHVDAGKSTLMGHTLFDLGIVSKRLMHKYEQDSKKMGKQSFVYAWVLDETGEERERGITMDVGSTKFETPTKVVTLLDAPGHKDFIPNMISGATQADVALLVVDGTRGEFETGFEQGGQTREHAMLVKSLGISQLGVVVNKLDTVNWSKERFDEIVSKLSVFLRKTGFKDDDITYIPCSGLTGENLVNPPSDSELVSWYNGPTLIQVIDKFKMPERSIDKPFRMSVSDIYKGTSSGFCVYGRIETGVLRTNDKILVCPLKEQAVVKGITIDDMARTSVFAGDHVAVTLSGVDVSNMSVGCILCDISNPIPMTQRIRARIIVLNIKVPITIGTPVLLHQQSLIEPAAIVKLNAQLNKTTVEVIKKNPRCLGSNSHAVVEIETTRAICIERYDDCKELGRVMLRVGGVTIAAGVVMNILR
ncbi:HBS1-like protein [Bradysia coprophila]|uniref:HBS1-like protein n=1 Tax=Bradysia coprophila TaxID=38358 RepID=UPI00187DBA1C|nr:HBS1-like protein [Bradysia coprophila]